MWRGRGSIEGYIHTQPSLLCAQLEVSLASGSAGLSQVAHDDQEVDCRGQQLCWEIGYCTVLMCCVFMLLCACVVVIM